MSDWKQQAIDSWERHCEETELQESERKNFRIESARKKFQSLNIPLPADAEIRVDDHENDAELGAIPYVTIDGIEFTLGPSRSQEHGGGLGIVTTCPRCQQRLRGCYIYDQQILGRELLNPDRVSHVCQTDEEKQEAAEIAASAIATESSEQRLLDALRDVVDEQIEQRTGAA